MTKPSEYLLESFREGWQAAELDPARSAQPLAITRHDGHTVLVFKDPGGESLDRVLERASRQPLDLTYCLRTAIGIATALGEMHRRGLIHKDIKPANVLVDFNDNVWLTGFGIASRLTHHIQSPAPPEIIAGTLAYMAPEQTGRMNSSVDTRSDLYSLGVTLYQMLTGELPFAAVDAMEWIHCHIARRPTPPRDRAAVPELLSSLIMKLLAKNAEERYQTASGLETDLRQCLAEWQSHGRIDPFPLGAHDASDRLLIPKKLYGREREIDALLTTFNRMVTHGAPELVLVSGYSGVGKSSVVNELHKALVPPRGLFASGKFDQYKRDIPYATLAQAVQTLVRQILVKSEEQVSKWRSAIAEAVGSNGQLIVNLIPEVEVLIGKQSPVPDLPPQDAQNRFQLVFRRFLSVFARPEHPLVLFLDDLQWLDTATLELLERLTTDADIRHLMLVGAYRDNEVSPSHPLARTLESMRNANVRVQEIMLAPLGIDDVDSLVADALRCAPERARSLAQLVHEKTGGNPLFAIQFLTALADEGLLSFDPVAQAWQSDIDGIRAMKYTDNVVDLMAEKLKRLSTTTQEALKHFACLGNVAEVATLTIAQGKSEDELHDALSEAVDAGLIFRHEHAYQFLHDRIQEAAYSLIPENSRAGIHLHIGRTLLAGMTADKLAEHLFDVANQLNRGALKLVDPDEKVLVATIDLSAGRKAKTAAAHKSACVYLASGTDLLDERDWASHYEFTFNLWIERAECELLSGNFEKAEQLIDELLQRDMPKVDQAAVYCLKVRYHITKSENQQAVTDALTGLRLFGIDIPAHPSWEEVEVEYETFWQILDGRPIESLIDLPLMTDPKMKAVMLLFSVLTAPAYFTDFGLWCIQLCRMVKTGIQHGTSDASAHAFAYWGVVIAGAFHRYHDAHRFAKLAYDLVNKHGFVAYQAKIGFALGTVAFWTQPSASAIDFARMTFRAAIEMGDLTFACYGMIQSVTGLLLQNAPLDAVWRESDIALDLARKANYGDAADIIVNQQRFIATMLGRTVTFSSFSDAQFDEATFEAQLTGDRMPLMIAWYWILKLKARFLSGDYTEALAASDRVKPLLLAAAAQITLLDYFYYAALTIAACYEHASVDLQKAWRELLTAHLEQLGEWAENYPPTFADKYALVSAEIARLEKRDPDAMRLYEQAIRLARDHGFIQNEGLAYEVAAQFYSARSFETIAHAYLCNARNCYDRWGAAGKVKQLDARYPHLHDPRGSASLAATIGVRVAQLDVETVVKASQALSSEIVLSKLIENLMRTALEHAGAERCLLILLRADEPIIEAEAATVHGIVKAAVRHTAITSANLPESVLNYVIRTRERVVLDDASVRNLYSEDEYIQVRRPRSVLCLPVVKQTKLVGALFLENNLTPRAFTSDRVAVLELLASQAAISLENANLYSDLQRKEAFLAEAQSISHTGSFGWILPSEHIYWSEEIYNILEYDRATKPTLELVFQRVHPDDRVRGQQTLDRAVKECAGFDLEHRLLMLDGRVKYLHVLARALKITSGSLEFVGAVTDVTERTLAEEKIRQSERELRQRLDLSPQHIAEFGPDRSRLFTNQAALDYYGLTLEEWQVADGYRLLHPQDAERERSEVPSKFNIGSRFEIELRLRRRDKQYRWFLFRFNPMLNEQGRITRWHAAGSDIEDRKETEQRLRNENVALREEIDKASMFEEIVGTSPVLQTVLSRVSKVAPSDSSVLITGETGTGKELVARAIHRRSRRVSRAFVSVNCAAIPRDLIASELFGHEKGAFTGATQRRVGRFELAEGGTIFLDEVGELPAETQIALLRVLQEREFERVGGTGSIQADVRVIAATNRDLDAAIASGTFRRDLFYRLNVFPIEMPSLRERRGDIPLLVEYFIDRYARKAGKSFQSVNKKSLDLLQSYQWPGNIRELQNVIERSVIVCDTENFSVDESWLSQQSVVSESTNSLELSQVLATQEKEMIEAALRQSGGRVYGPSGAAAKLAIPGSTLASKIKSLKISKRLFKET
jgi:PAS domain S-box-containing protein